MEKKLGSLAGPGFEPGSGRPKRPMIVHYTIPPYYTMIVGLKSFKPISGVSVFLNQLMTNLELYV